MCTVCWYGKFSREVVNHGHGRRVHSIGGSVSYPTKFRAPQISAGRYLWRLKLTDHHWGEPMESLSRQVGWLALPLAGLGLSGSRSSSSTCASELAPRAVGRLGQKWLHSTCAPLNSAPFGVMLFPSHFMKTLSRLQFQFSWNSASQNLFGGRGFGQTSSKSDELADGLCDHRGVCNESPS